MGLIYGDQILLMLIWERFPEWVKNLLKDGWDIVLYSMHFRDGKFFACGFNHFFFSFLKNFPEFDALAVHGEKL